MFSLLGRRSRQSEASNDFVHYELPGHGAKRSRLSTHHPFHNLNATDFSKLPVLKDTVPGYAANSQQSSGQLKGPKPKTGIAANDGQGLSSTVLQASARVISPQDLARPPIHTWNRRASNQPLNIAVLCPCNVSGHACGLNDCGRQPICIVSSSSSGLIH